MVSKIKEKSIANNAITTSKLSAEVAAVTGIKVSSITYIGDDTAANVSGGDVITVSGSGFTPNTVVYVDRTQASVVTYVSNNQITFSSPAKSSGSYILYLYNADGGSAAYIPGINYSGVPAWSTASGSLGTTYEFTSFTGNVSTLSASSDTSVYYLLNSGTLPPGSTLNANTGVISGNTSVINSPTTYNFTIEAKDQENQGTLRNFSITINPDVVTWSSPAEGATINVSIGTATSQALNASSVSGKVITFTANTLPTGLNISGNTVTGTPTVIQSITSLITATAAATNRTATRILNWIVAIANDLNFPYVSTLLKTSASSTRSTTVVDSSTNAFTVTRNGAPSTGWTSPYQTDGYWGNYFNGSTDYLTIPANTAFAFGTGNFTVESWVYTTARIGSGNYGSQIAGCNVFGTSADWIFNISPTGNLYFQITSSPTGAILSSSTVPLNTWIHVAVVRSSGVVTLYINGTNAGGSASYTTSVTNASTSFSIGGAVNGSANSLLQGYISNLRIVKGTAVYTSAFTPSTTPLTAISGTSLLTCQSNRFKDNSTNNFTITPTGTPRVTPDWYPSTFTAPAASVGAGYFPLTSANYLQFPVSSAFAPGTGDFTLECWVYRVSGTDGYIWTQTVSGTNYFMLTFGSSTANFIATLSGGGTPGISGPANSFFSNVWNHVAVTRSNGTVRVFVNGVSGTPGSNTTDLSNVSYVPTIGRYAHTAAFGIWTGYISNLRYVKGTAVYTANFTPSTTPLTAIPNTSLLTNFTNAAIYDATVQNVITTVGDAKTDTTTKQWSPSSTFLNGSANYLTMPATPQWAMSGDWTLEAWIYPTTVSGVQIIINTRNLSAVTSPVMYLNGSSLVIDTGAAPVISAGTISINSWQYVAATRSGNSWKLFIGGSQVGITTTNTTSYSTAYGCAIGRSSAGENFNGYIQDVRVTKGVARTIGTPGVAFPTR